MLYTMTPDELEAIRKRAAECENAPMHNTAWVAKCMVSAQDVGPLLDALDAAWKELDRIPGSMA